MRFIYPNGKLFHSIGVPVKNFGITKHWIFNGNAHRINGIWSIASLSIYSLYGTPVIVNISKLVI